MFKKMIGLQFLQCDFWQIIAMIIFIQLSFSEVQIKSYVNVCSLNYEKYFLIIFGILSHYFQILVLWAPLIQMFYGNSLKLSIIHNFNILGKSQIQVTKLRYRANPSPNMKTLIHITKSLKCKSVHTCMMNIFIYF